MLMLGMAGSVRGAEFNYSPSKGSFDTDLNNGVNSPDGFISIYFKSGEEGGTISKYFECNDDDELKIRGSKDRTCIINIVGNNNARISKVILTYTGTKRTLTCNSQELVDSDGTLVYDTNSAPVSSLDIINNDNNFTVTQISIIYETGPDNTPPAFTLADKDAVEVNGNLVITANEDIKYVDGTTSVSATLNSETVTGTLSGRNITFSTNLAYDTDYTLVIAAGQVQDLSDNKNNETTIDFHTKKLSAPEFVTPWNNVAYDASTASDDYWNQTTEELTVKIAAEDGADVYYTTDGSDPTKVRISNKYDKNDGIVITSLTTIKAAAMKNGSYSDVATAYYVIAGKHTYVIKGVAGETVEPGEQRTTEMGDITMTYGGDKNVEKDEYEKLNKTPDGCIGTQGFMTLGIIRTSQNDTRNEFAAYTKGEGEKSNSVALKENAETGEDGEFNHTYYSGLTTTHDKTFYLPTYGGYYMFEPKKDGKLTVYVNQQGGMPYSDGTLQKGKMRMRPVYILDESGNSVSDVKATTTSKIHEEWTKIDKNEFASDNMFTKEEMQNIYDAYAQWISDNNLGLGADATEPQGVIVLHNKDVSEYTNNGVTYTYTNDMKSKLNAINGGSEYNDNTGYMLISEGYVNYEFPVEAGKTYFIFGYRTKLGICGFSFEADENYAAEDLTINEDADNANAISGAVGKKYNVTIGRTFQKGVWSSLVLPFSVGPTQLKEVFGNDVEVIHFTDITGTTLNLTKHVHQMIVAGTPVMIKHNKEENVVNPKFENVTIETAEVCSTTDSNGNSYTGSFGKTKMPANSYFVSTDNNIYQSTADREINGFRAWIETPDGTEKALTIKFGSINGGNGETTGITSLTMTGDVEVPSDVYNINGQMVRSGSTDLNGLAKGIYIVNGKKYVVK